MRVLGLDFETNGLNTAEDRITEIGAVLWDVQTKTPLLMEGIYLHDDTYPPQPAEIVRLTGITDSTLREFGLHPRMGLARLEEICEKYRPEYIVAHNGENFDRPFLKCELSRSGVEAPVLSALPWIDTRADIPFDVEPESRRLKHLALDQGFINPFAHRAVFDVLTMLRVLGGHDIEKVIAYQKIPFVVCRAMTNYDQKELAKAQRYSWEKIGDKVYPKMWVKRVKENLLEQEIENCKKGGFQSVRIE
jgi:DNA polymerase-3 subunit epsilon